MSTTPENDALKRVESKIDDGAKRFDEFDERLKQVETKVKSRSVSLPGSADEGKTLNLAKIVRGMAGGGLDNAAAWEDAGFEREVGLQARKRALSYGTASAGGYLVPEEQLRTMIDLLRAKTVSYELGVIDFGGLTGAPVTMPRQTGGATAYWVAENSEITDSQQTWDEISMVPHELAAMTKLSNRLIALSNPQAEQVVRNDLMSVMARKLDLAILRGDGASNSPTGIANTGGINVATSVGAPTVDDLYDWLYALEADNADVGKLGFAFHPRTVNTFRKLKDQEDRYILQPNPAQPFTGTLIGLPYRTTTAIPITRTGDTDVGGAESEAYLCNWSDVLVGRWGGMEILASNVAGDAFAKNMTWVRIIGEFDVALRHPESCVYATGITA